MNCHQLRIIYAGTPDFSVPTLQSLVGSDHEVVAVFTQPDRPAGRGRKLLASPVKQTALSFSIPVFQPETMKGNNNYRQIESLKADIMVVAAYGMILPERVLNIPILGSINIHASLLPRWRGAAPIQRAIEAGDNQTGITFMQMAKGLDAGDILYKTQMAIGRDTNAQQVHDELAQQGARGLLKILPMLCEGRIKPAPQDESLATYARKLHKKDAQIDWSKSALQIHKQICAYNPFPVAHTQLDGLTTRIWRSEVVSEFGSAGGEGEVVSTNDGKLDVACGAGVLRILFLQLSSKKAIDAQAFLNGRDVLGSRFG